jgi:hypothetical protein
MDGTEVSLFLSSYGRLETDVPCVLCNRYARGVVRLGALEGTRRA